MTFRKSTLAAALIAALTGGMALTAQAGPGDFHRGPYGPHHGPRPCQGSVYQALTPEKQAQYDAIMQDFADKTAPLRDKLAAKYIEVRTLGESPAPDPKAVGKATEELVALRNEFAKERQAMIERIAKEVGINVLYAGPRGHGCPGPRPLRCPATGITVMPDGPQADAPEGQ